MCNPGAISIGIGGNARRPVSPTLTEQRCRDREASSQRNSLAVTKFLLFGRPSRSHQGPLILSKGKTYTIRRSPGRNIATGRVTVPARGFGMPFGAFRREPGISVPGKLREGSKPAKRSCDSPIRWCLRRGRFAGRWTFSANPVDSTQLSRQAAGFQGPAVGMASALMTHGEAKPNGQRQGQHRSRALQRVRILRRVLSYTRPRSLVCFQLQGIPSAPRHRAGKVFWLRPLRYVLS